MVIKFQPNIIIVIKNLNNPVLSESSKAIGYVAKPLNI